MCLMEIMYRMHRMYSYSLSSFLCSNLECYFSTRLVTTDMKKKLIEIFLSAKHFLLDARDKGCCQKQPEEGGPSIFLLNTTKPFMGKPFPLAATVKILPKFEEQDKEPL